MASAANMGPFQLVDAVATIDGDVRELKPEPGAGNLELTLPAHSVTILRSELRRG